MITCEKTNDGYELKGLTVLDLETIQTGLCSQFNQATRKEHHSFRTLVLRINRPIEAVLDKIYNAWT